MKTLIATVALAAASVFGLVLGSASASSASEPPAGWVPRVSVMVNVEIGGSPTAVQRTAIDAALAAMSLASGDWYRDAGTTTQVPQLATIDSIPFSLEIWVGPRAASDLLQVDGTADKGYTRWTYSGHAAIALLDSTLDSWFQALTMHELMLSRHITERDDPGGMLGHVMANLRCYPPQDVALLR